MNIVFASHSAFDPNLVVGSHHLAREMSQQGHRVLHLSAPVTSAHLSRWTDARVRQRITCALQGPVLISTDLWEWIPFTAIPWQWSRRGDLSQRNAFAPGRRALQRSLASVGMTSVDALLIDDPRLIGIQRGIDCQRITYRATDLYAEMKGDPYIQNAERILCELATTIIATSEPVAKHLRSLGSPTPVTTLENGVDLEFFRVPRDPHPTLRNVRRPRLVYVGAVDNRFDHAVLIKLASLRPDVEILIYGPISTPRDRRVETPDNVSYLGPARYDEIPSILQHCDIGLIPMNNHPANEARSPMKFYEYAAAGLPILARSTAELRRRSLPATFLYDDHNVCEQLENAVGFRVDSSTDLVRHSWTEKAKRVLQLSVATECASMQARSIHCRPAKREAC